MKKKRESQKAGAVTDRSGPERFSAAPLLAVIRLWKERAHGKFESAKLEPDVMGRKLIEHGAICYFNAATELEEALKQNRADVSLRS